MRRLTGSLYGRMLAIAGAATGLALILAGFVIAATFDRFVTQGLDRRLDAAALLLAGTVRPDGRIDATLLRERAAALDGGPGWRWRITGPDGTVGSADAPSPAPELPRPGPPPPPPPPGPRSLDLAREDGLPLHARQVFLASTRGLVTITAAAPRDVIRAPVRDALVPLLALIAVLGALLTGAVLLQLRVGLRPLRRLRSDVAAIRTGAVERIEGDQAAELRPLVDELNALAADNRAALTGVRLSTANLAHALKTPVAALALEAAPGSRAAGLVARIDRTIGHHLSRARTLATDRRVSTPLLAATTDIVDTVRRMQGARAANIAIDIDRRFTVALDPQDLDELLGNLIDNAARHGESRVMIAAQRQDRIVRLSIVDDGPGLSEADRRLALKPGLRLDERAPGHGFGLAIVAELVALYGGTLRLDSAESGGLAAAVDLPSGA